MPAVVSQAGTTRGRAAADRCFIGLECRKGGIVMTTYIVLASFTDQGIRNVKDTTKRADAVRELAKKFAVTAKEFFWTLGSYDVVAIFEAPDDASMTALGLAIGAGGNVRTQTLRAFSRDEMNAVLAKVG
jgi:uncharacterized protein with GYD domain